MLTKAEYDKYHRSNFKEAFAIASKSLDRYLNSGVMSISTDNIKKLVNLSEQTAFIEYVCQRYRQGGWKVERDRYNDGCEDWDVLRFS